MEHSVIDRTAAFWRSENMKFVCLDLDANRFSVVPGSIQGAREIYFIRENRCHFCPLRRSHTPRAELLPWSEYEPSADRRQQKAMRLREERQEKRQREEVERRRKIVEAEERLVREEAQRRKIEERHQEEVERKRKVAEQEEEDEAQRKKLRVQQDGKEGAPLWDPSSGVVWMTTEKDLMCHVCGPEPAGAVQEAEQGAPRWDPSGGRTWITADEDDPTRAGPERSPEEEE